MTTKITEFNIGEQKYKLTFTRGNMYGHHCFSLHIIKEFDDLPIIIFYKSRLIKGSEIVLKIENSYSYYTTSIKEGKRKILNYLLNENI